MEREQIIQDNVDILEDQIPQDLLVVLLQDHTTGKNILWGTDIEHNEKSEIKIEEIIGENGLALRPRVRKSEEEKRLRTKKRAEVFTPSWICNEQLNAADMLWFYGKACPVSGSPFNKVDGKTWKASSLLSLKRAFEKTGRDWKQYILEDKIEMCCGEGPYLTSRYDVVSEREIPVSERIGILDRKLRVINAFIGAGDSKCEWIKWAKAAYQHTYGFEWQGDNLLLTREALLYTFVDNLIEYNLGKSKKIKRMDSSNRSFGDIDFNAFRPDDMSVIHEIADIISWNCWQMDGLTGCTPYVSPSMEFKKLIANINKNSDNVLFEATDTIPKEFCRIKDWNENIITTYAEVYAEAVKAKTV